MQPTSPLPTLDAYASRMLPLRAQAEVRNGWLRERLDTLMPELMKRANIDMWLVVAREYAEDPVIMTLLPEPAMSARRRTILMFFKRPDGKVERQTLHRYGYGDFYSSAWDPAKEDQFICLARMVAERNPKRIGLDTADEFPFGDGLTHSEHERVVEALGAFVSRVVSAETLVVGWLERRIAPELSVYPGLVELGHALIGEAFSSRVIQPGITTTDDLVWWFRQRMFDFGLQAWFHPSVEIQAHGLSFSGPAGGGKAAPRKLIQPGDLLHCDVGFYHLGLATDQQQNAYVLRPGEHDAPKGLKAVLADGNALQDIHMAEMKVGRSGNEVLRNTLKKARARKIVAQVYSHPLGYHGHAAGPTIGLWDQQDGVPGRGDYPVFDDTVYSIELNAKREVPEWDGQLVRMALEEDAVMTGGSMRWLHGRQTALHLIG